MLVYIQCLISISKGASIYKRASGPIMEDDIAAELNVSLTKNSTFNQLLVWGREACGGPWIYHWTSSSNFWLLVFLDHLHLCHGNLPLPLLWVLLEGASTWEAHTNGRNIIRKKDSDLSESESNYWYFSDIIYFIFDVQLSYNNILTQFLTELNNNCQNLG